MFRKMSANFEDTTKSSHVFFFVKRLTRYMKEFLVLYPLFYKISEIPNASSGRSPIMCNQNVSWSIRQLWRWWHWHLSIVPVITDNVYCCKEINWLPNNGNCFLTGFKIFERGRVIYWTFLKVHYLKICNSCNEKKNSYQ